MDYDMRHLWRPRTWIWLDKLRNRVARKPAPFKPFVFLDDGTICETCGESVPEGAILPCCCIRNLKEQEFAAIERGST